MANNEESKTNVIDEYIDENNKVEECKKVYEDFLQNGRLHIGNLSKSAYQLRMTIMAPEGKELIVPTSGSLNGKKIEDGLIIPAKQDEKSRIEKTK